MQPGVDVRRLGRCCLEQLVLVGEQTHDRLAACNALDRFCDQRSHSELANFSAGAASFAQRNGVGHHDFVEGITLGNAFNRRAREDGVRAVGVDIFGTTCFLDFSSFDQSACGIDHVVHDHAVAAFDVANDVHHFRYVGFRAALVDDGQIATELLGQSASTHHATHIG